VDSSGHAASSVEGLVAATRFNAFPGLEGETGGTPGPFTGEDARTTTAQERGAPKLLIRVAIRVGGVIGVAVVVVVLADALIQVFGID